MEIMSDFFEENVERLVPVVGLVRWNMDRNWQVGECGFTGFEEKWKFGWYRTTTGVVSDFFEDMVRGLVTCVVVVRWKVGWSLVMSEIKPTGFEEKWKRLVGHVNLFEEKWVTGW